MFRELELSWAAGFYDGEGCTHGGNMLQASVSQVNRANLFRFQRAVGVGNVLDARSMPNRSPISAWQAYGDNAWTALRALWPYLGPAKHDQAIKAFTAYMGRDVRKRPGLPRCQRGHERTGERTKSGCRQCKRDRGQILFRTAWDHRLHGVREYVPTAAYAPSVET